LNINFSVLFYDGLSLLAAHVYKPVKFIRAWFSVVVPDEGPTLVRKFAQCYDLF
jgi:hypothetical protein